jgi:hypothetical protein
MQMSVCVLQIARLHSLADPMHTYTYTLCSHIRTWCVCMIFIIKSNELFAFSLFRRSHAYIYTHALCSHIHTWCVCMIFIIKSSELFAFSLACRSPDMATLRDVIVTACMYVWCAYGSLHVCVVCIWQPACMCGVHMTA